ncbi:MAG TPA: AAA family ATPase [Ktedonobacteraceae bacterium]|jgi:hypothetical protein|nr:AAA family ATPase [Ktedonobacteraceae bacterium]
MVWEWGRFRRLLPHSLFLVGVCAWNIEVRGEVLVFDGGCWKKDRQLFKSIKGATLDNLILRGNLKQEIYNDLVQFFAARETYERYGIPWKRGVIFVGPPGNGKTHAVKAIINAIQQPCLYVKSFKAEYRTDEDNIRLIFDRARKSAPCILVLEDLDSLVTWNKSLQDALQISGDVQAQLAEQSEGFSFAYLKELFLSSMMRWINRIGQETMEQIMAAQVEVLREQMASANALTAQQPAESASESVSRFRRPVAHYIIQGRPVF